MGHSAYNHPDLTSPTEGLGEVYIPDNVMEGDTAHKISGPLADADADVISTTRSLTEIRMFFHPAAQLAKIVFLPSR